MSELLTTYFHDFLFRSRVAYHEVFCLYYFFQLLYGEPQSSQYLKTFLQVKLAVSMLYLVFFIYNSCLFFDSWKKNKVQKVICRITSIKKNLKTFSIQMIPHIHTNGFSNVCIVRGYNCFIIGHSWIRWFNVCKLSTWFEWKLLW